MAAVRLDFRTYGRTVKTESWQGIKNEVTMFELCNVYLRAMMPNTATFMAFMTDPDLPWAALHFQERVGRKPVNPGETYKEWPHYKGRNAEFNDRNFKPDGKFSHTYMERYWPKHASVYGENQTISQFGIRYPYGDLDDVVNLLLREPYTRQAYLPIFFPEDTGAVHGGRVPCSLGYHFMLRDNQLHVHYTIRACDYLRHFKNDIFLTMRLADWVLGELLIKDDKKFWSNMELGIFTMDIISLHVFDKEKNLI